MSGGAQAETPSAM